MYNEPRQEKLNQVPRLYQTENVPLMDKTIHLHFFLGGQRPEIHQSSGFI